MNHLYNNARIPDFVRAAMLASAEAIMSIRPPDVVIGDESDPYVHRWHVIERADHANIYIHRFFRDDHDGALHDHRMRNVSVILDGECMEHFHREPLLPQGDGFATYAVLRRAGDVVERAAEVPHRIALIDRKPMTTMFFTGPKVREWGFVTVDGWVYWKEYNERIGNVRPNGNYKGDGPTLPDTDGSTDITGPTTTLSNVHDEASVKTSPPGSPGRVP